MSKLAFTYLIFPLAMLVLWFFSKDLELPQGIEDTGISRAYLKISLFIFRNINLDVRKSVINIRMFNVRFYKLIINIVKNIILFF